MPANDKKIDEMPEQDETEASQDDSEDERFARLSRLSEKVQASRRRNIIALTFCFLTIIFLAILVLTFGFANSIVEYGNPQNSNSNRYSTPSPRATPIRNDFPDSRQYPYSVIFPSSQAKVLQQIKADSQKQREDFEKFASNTANMFTEFDEKYLREIDKTIGKDFGEKFDANFNEKFQEKFDENFNKDFSVSFDKKLNRSFDSKLDENEKFKKLLKDVEDLKTALANSSSNIPPCIEKDEAILPDSAKINRLPYLTYIVREGIGRQKIYNLGIEISLGDVKDGMLQNLAVYSDGELIYGEPPFEGIISMGQRIVFRDKKAVYSLIPIYFNKRFLSKDYIGLAIAKGEKCPDKLDKEKDSPLSK